MVRQQDALAKVASRSCLLPRERKFRQVQLGDCISNLRILEFSGGPIDASDSEIWHIFRPLRNVSEMHVALS